jgi:hypothetical protein
VTANPRKAVRAAERILWAWTAWVTGLGIYQSGTSVQSTEKLVTDHLSVTMPFNPEALQVVVIAGYVVTAGFLAWMVLKIGEGKGWARTSLALNFAFDAFSTVMPPLPWHQRPVNGGSRPWAAGRGRLPALHVAGAAQLSVNLPEHRWLTVIRRSNVAGYGGCVSITVFGVGRRLGD